MSEAAEKLRAARELIARPGGWTQNAFSRGASRRAINISTRVRPEHVCFCAIGAMVAVKAVDASSQAGRAADLFAEAVGRSIGEQMPSTSIPVWNDAPGRTQAEVVDAFDRAIALAEAEAA